jgi:hypothetical protein
MTPTYWPPGPIHELYSGSQTRTVFWVPETTYLLGPRHELYYGSQTRPVFWVPETTCLLGPRHELYYGSHTRPVFWVPDTNCLLPLEHWGRGFESHSMHGYLCVFILATGCGLATRGVGIRVPVGSRIFASSHRPERLRGLPSPPIRWHRGVKLPEREADHLPPTSAEFKKTWIYTHTPPILHHGVVLS